MFPLKIISLILFTSLAFVNCKVNFNVQILTFNVNVKEPVNDISGLLGLEESAIRPDVYAIGLQEVNPIISFTKENEFLWTQALDKYFTKFNYELVGTANIQTSVLFVFVKSDKRQQFSSFESATIKTGFNGILGNKGAQAIRFDYNGRSFCFINSHLPAHDDKLYERIDAYNKIEKGLIFGQVRARKVLEHDLIFWFGDLNFRLDGVTTTTVMNEIQSGKPVQQIANNLLRYDQLLSVIQKQKAFTSYKDSLINFLPTFKFFVDTDNYNLKRVPAYTDRILYRLQRNGITVQTVTYKSLPQYKISDHKPVKASFSINIA